MLTTDHGVRGERPPWEYKNQLEFGKRFCVSLWHTKGNDNCSEPLFFEIIPECSVLFGEGDGLDDDPIDINKGWDLG